MVFSVNEKEPPFDPQFASPQQSSKVVLVFMAWILGTDAMGNAAQA